MGVIPSKVRSYVSKVVNRSEREWTTWRRGTDGREYVYTLRDFDRMECIFVHVPRAAGTSISEALFGHCAGGHRTVREYLDLFGEAFWTYDTFTFVRNPYARLVSAYEYLRRGGHPAWPEDRAFAEEITGKYDGFQSFVLQGLRPDRVDWPVQHFYPQTHFLTLDGEIAVDFVGHVETIEADFTTVCDHLGEESELPRRNATPGSYAPVASYYESDAVLRRVQEVYGSDFEHFDYAYNVESAEAPPQNRAPVTDSGGDARG